MTYNGSDSRAKADIARKTEEDDQLLRSLKPLKTGAAVLIAATLIAVFLNFLPVISFRPLAVPRFLTQPKAALLQWQSSKAEEPVEETPKVIYFQARPSAEPTPPPAITGFRLSAYGRELGPDGFTTYVEDKPVVLTLEIIPFMSHPPVEWIVSDEEAASLTVSNDKKSCEFAALKSAGKIDLTVRCNEAEIVMPVYLWSNEA